MHASCPRVRRRPHFSPHLAPPPPCTTLLRPAPPPSPELYSQIPRKGKAAQTDKVRCYEPATMKYLGYFPALTPDEVKEHIAQAGKAQKIWSKSSFKQRRQFLRILLKYILEHQDLI